MSLHQQTLTKAMHTEGPSRWKREWLWKQNKTNVFFKIMQMPVTSCQMFSAEAYNRMSVWEGFIVTILFNVY